MSGFFELDFKERSLWILFEQEDGPPTVRADYRKLTCGSCGKVDELKALESGISKEVSVPKTDADAFLTDDSQVVVSARTRELLEGIAGLQARFFPLPAARGFCVMYPAVVIEPPQGSRIYRPKDVRKAGDIFHRWGQPCKGCGRTSEITWTSEEYTPPADLVLAGVMLEEKRGRLIAWIANKAVADAIKKNKLKGIKASKPE